MTNNEDLSAVLMSSTPGYLGFLYNAYNAREEGLLNRTYAEFPCMQYDFENLKQNILCCPKDFLNQSCPVIYIPSWMTDITLTIPEVFAILIRGFDIN